MAILNYNPPKDPYLHFIYRDDDIAILEKPSGLLSVPGKAPEHRDSLAWRVATVLPTATVVHRLDMATSGLMIFALNKQAHRAISKQFELRQIDKTYYALIYGIPTRKSGQINLPLICDWPNRPKQMVDHERGKKAITDYQVIQTQGDVCKVQLHPITGRSHQLRVHMLSMGHPILGDRLYAHPEALALSPRLCLHAASISFTHPTTAQKLSFESKPNFPEIPLPIADK
ncbi:pseudouridine synthase [Glaciecola sp. 1036]|uniref:pseudouridine synthase n=1 Tax=Alteromonadaceae TaxID=72275 RepID=UPI003D06B9F4